MSLPAARRGQPRVTIVTPSFNRAGLLAITARSVLAQDERDFEYLVIDDGSTDGTEGMVHALGDPRVTYLRHENRGEAATTNRGWAMARGEYFAVLSSDDLVKPGWLAAMLRFMEEHPEVLVAYPDYDIIDLDGRVTQVVRTPDYVRDRMIASFHPYPGVGAVIRRSALRDLRALRNPEYRFAPDLDSWLRLSLRGPFARVGQVLASWRRHDGSITEAERPRARGAEMVRIAERFFETPDLRADVLRLKPFTLAQACSTASAVLATARPLTAALYLRRSHAVSPVQPDFIPTWLGRPPPPRNRRLLRLAAAGVVFRAMPLLRAVGRRLPPDMALRGRTGLERLGLLPAVPPPPPVPAPEPVAAPPPPAADPARERFTALLPQVRDDLAAFRDSVGVFSPTAPMLDLLAQRVAVPAAPALAGVTARILGALPGRIDHLLVVPWVSAKGGSETVTERLVEALRRLRGVEGLCVVAPDGYYQPAGLARYHGLPFLGLSDIDAGLDEAARAEILDRILVQRRPRVVHGINSLAGWQVLRDRGRDHAADCAFFANIYSDIRLADGAPAASYYYDYLPHCVEALSGVIADNHAVLRRAGAAFGLGPALAAKTHVLRTPVLGLDGGDAARDLRPYRPGAGRRSLWLSRIAPEKRLDVLGRIAARCPGRQFDMRGADNGLAPDVSAVRGRANVAILGAFSALSAIPWDDYDSYVFTTSGEGMPIALLEIAARGLPLVAPAVGGIGEFVTSETGWLIPDQDGVEDYVAALAAIEADPAEAARRVAAAQALLLRDFSRNAFDAALRAIPRYLDGGR